MDRWLQGWMGGWIFQLLLTAEVRTKNFIHENETLLLLASIIALAPKADRKNYGYIPENPSVTFEGFCAIYVSFYCINIVVCHRVREN